MKKIIILLSLLFFATCYNLDEEYPKKEEAYIEIYAAILYKEAECGQKPALPIIFMDRPKRTAMNACVFSIVKSNCPFLTYPLVCLEMFKVDVPYVLPPGVRLRKN
ncbi:MAG: hypothetical protein H7A25_25200 [Leptospiraceae bacterium]|nr:hypothetical protein [Leptospiraceae bacterium]MCP5503219.1 hypothetical protein [Leptospiraceae bacterium]